MPGFTLDMMSAGLSAGAANAINGASLGAQTATGASQGTAFLLGNSTTEFTTVAASTGAILPAAGGRVLGGDVLVVVNQGANALSVYPPIGKQVGLIAANSPATVASGKTGIFLSRGDGNYFAVLGA